MEIIKKNQSQVFNYDTITAYEYASKNKYINIGLVKINGRYPKQNFIINQDVTELIYINNRLRTVFTIFRRCCHNFSKRKIFFQRQLYCSNTMYSPLDTRTNKNHKII